MADLIAENEYLVPNNSLIEHDKEGDYLYIATIDETDNSEEDSLHGKLS